MLQINGGPASAMRPVIGTTSDGHDINTLFGLAHKLDDHTHKGSGCIPSQAAALVLTGTSTSWELGDKISIGSSVISGDFDYHFVNFESMSGNDTYECVIFKGATTGGTEIGRTRVTRVTNQVKHDSAPIQTRLLDAEQKTFARICHESTTKQTVNISIFYHTY